MVNARDLHEFLESRKDFSSWIKDRIERYDLTENEDYVVFPKFGENSKGGRPKKEYALTLDAAKELSMVEGNEKGKLMGILQEDQVFISSRPGCILYRFSETIQWAYLNDLLGIMED